MARFLLIHGSCHGAWCWRDVLPLLRAAGHTANAIDLPSHGDDPTPVGEVTLERYAQAIVDAITDPVILVGHSMGGYPITRAAEMAPEKIQRLVYLCAYTPWKGFSLAQMRKAAPRQPLLEAMIKSDDQLSITFDPLMIEDKFYHDCPPGTVDYARQHLCAQAIQPNEVPVEITQNSAGKPRSYIVCNHDHAIPPEFQREMAARFAPQDVREMDISHSPFFADPDALAKNLIEISEMT